MADGTTIIVSIAGAAVGIVEGALEGFLAGRRDRDAA